ncbi:TOM20 (YGR082W) [Zygosaccharomyces parabailii]|nr:TOM20 (YGR082W) [Zygosaccharomyces parabailii]
MSQSSTISRALTVTGVLAAVSLAGYAIYFDHKRRSSPEFRKHLKSKSKRQAAFEKKQKEEAKQVKLQKVSEYLAKELAANPTPTDPSRREETFTSNVEQGERLSVVPGKELEAAAKFYRALSVYPNPADLLGIYQRSVPETVYEYIVMMIAILPPANISTFLSGATEQVQAQAETAAMAQANDIDE